VAAVCPTPLTDDQQKNNTDDAIGGAKKNNIVIWLRPQEHRLSEPLILQAVEGVNSITLQTMHTTKASRRFPGRRRFQQPLASLLLQTRRRNKPLLQIASGKVFLRKIRLGHYCSGFNLWNGNAAVQVQPLLPPDQNNNNNIGDQPQLPPSLPPHLLPTAVLQDVEVISHSGRGVVINDGGNVTIENSYIHDCAATGIYVGSQKCHLRMANTDVISNGHGNQLAMAVHASGVSRGHSGFYLENGHATFSECNISNNSSCGISVSSGASRLVMEHSDVVANGHSNQIEVAWGAQQTGCHNNVAKAGLVKVRSLLGLQSCVGGTSSAASGRRRRMSSNSHSSRNNNNSPGRDEEEDNDDEDEEDLEHMEGSFVVAEENTTFGSLIEI